MIADLGLDNRKMSKSYANFIALSDSPEEITKKVSQMTTAPMISLSQPLR
jgi:tryptophanyl-tRNA synthetase